MLLLSFAVFVNYLMQLNMGMALVCMVEPVRAPNSNNNNSRPSCAGHSREEQQEAMHSYQVCIPMVYVCSKKYCGTCF